MQKGFKKADNLKSSDKYLSQKKTPTSQWYGENERSLPLIGEYLGLALEECLGGEKLRLRSRDELSSFTRT